MKNRLIRLGLTALVMAGGVGCADTSKQVNVTQPYVETTRTFPIRHISGYDFKTRDQSEEPYKLERIAIGNEQFYAQEIDSTKGALAFEFLPFDKVTREISLDSKNVILNSEEKYIPVRVKKKNGEYAKKVNLKAERDKQTGIPGVKSDILCFQKLAERAGVSEADYGFSAVTTEEDALYGIRTMKILGERYFFPYVEESEVDKPGKLNFYLIPLKGAKIEIQNSNGHISIVNGIYRPTLKSEIEKVEKSSTPGQGRVTTEDH